MPKSIYSFVILFVAIFVVMLSALTVMPAYSADEETPADTDADAAKTAAPPPSSPPRPEAVAPKSREDNLKSDIDHFLQPDELKTLLAGDNEVYALYRDDMTGRPKGVALLIPDWGLNTTNSRGMEYLRTELGDYGWVTLAMTVPQGKESVFTTEAAVADPAASPDSAKKPKPIRAVDDDFMQRYELQLKTRMMALISEAENYQGYFIVIAQGSSAAVLASLYAKGELAEPEALILLSAFVPDMTLRMKMNQDITVTAVPTLDVYQSGHSRWLKKNILLRRKLAKKNFKVHYRQKELYGDISYHNQNQRLLKEIYGWLSSLGI